MLKCPIGLGRCSKYLIFILGTVVFKTINNFIFDDRINPKNEGGIFGFVPVLSNHFYIQYFLRYISYIIGGFILEKVLIRKTETEKANINYSNEESNDSQASENNEVDSQRSLLIFNERNKNFKLKKYENLFVCTSYSISREIVRILYKFKFDKIEIWTFEILFILFFLKKYFVIHLYNYKKFALFIILIPTTILLVTSTILPYTNYGDGSLDKNSYEEIESTTGSKYYSIPISIVFLFATMFLSYSRVKSKVLMDLRYLSPYLIICYIGIAGAILTLIILIFSSFLKCWDGIDDICLVKDLKNDTILYLDNAYIYFHNLGNSGYKMYIEIFLVIPFFLIINFLEFACEILVIYFFNPYFILLRDNIYYFGIRLVFIIFNYKDYQKYISLTQFLILELSELLSIFAFGIYLEIIELRFCGLDRYLKRNSIKRSEEENNDNKDNKLITSMSSENEYYEENNSEMDMSNSN